MHLRHGVRTTALVVACALAFTPLSAAAAASRVAPVAGVLYVGTASEDGASAGPVSVRVGPGATSLVSLLGGHFHGDLCATSTAMFAGPGGINPAKVAIASDSTFAGSETSTAADGSKVVRTLRGHFSSDATKAVAKLAYSDTPSSGGMACTVTATLTLHKAPLVPTGAVVPPRRGTTYHAVSHQGWAATVVTSRSGTAATVVQVSAWDVCHYRAFPAAHFLYPEHLRTSAAIAHGKLVSHLHYTGGSGTVSATITGGFVGTGHHLAGSLHVTRSGSVGGSSFVCDTARVLFSAS